MSAEEVVPCEMITMGDICKIAYEEMSETEEEHVKILSFFQTVKGLETFWHLIESVEYVPEEVFECLRQT